MATDKNLPLPPHSQFQKPVLPAFLCWQWKNIEHLHCPCAGFGVYSPGTQGQTLMLLPNCPFILGPRMECEMEVPNRTQ